MNSAESFCEQIGLEIPVVQAGMGGGVTTGELVGAVSAAGGLGTVGIMGDHAFNATLGKARRIAGPKRPIAANLLVPFVHQSHIDICAEQHVSVVTLLGVGAERWIHALHARGIPVHITVGDAEQAQRAIAAGADGLVAQGIEAGGHHMAVKPLAQALPEILDVAAGRPVLAAGGVADAEDVRRLLAAGAMAAIAGTRFLLTDESGAHPEYQRRVLEAKQTLRTQLFSFGWPLPHRVIPNAATERWCGRDGTAPAWIRGIGRVASPVSRVIPLSALGTVAKLQRVNLGLFTATLPLRSMPAEFADRTALYAGETLHRLHDIIPAAEAVARLAP